MADGKRVIARIDGFAIDCIVNESHQRESDVTSVPTESGTATDNIKKKNRICTIEGIVSDTPAAEMVSERNFTQDDDVVTTQAACDTLESAWDQERTVVVETPMFTYKNCAIKSLTMPRDAKTGRALKFTATFEEIRIRQTLRLTVAVVRVADSRALPKKPLGKKAGKNINNERYLTRKGDTAYITQYGTYKGNGSSTPMDFKEFTEKQEAAFGDKIQAALKRGDFAAADAARDQAQNLENQYRSREGLATDAQFADDHPVLNFFTGLTNPLAFNRQNAFEQSL